MNVAMQGREAHVLVVKMLRWLPAVVVLLCACGRQAPGEPSDDGPPRDSVHAEPAPEPSDPSDEQWLVELLAFDLRAAPTDARVINLARRMHSPVTCPQPGTGCYIELELGGLTTQVHMGDDQALQVWGPIEEREMAPWVAWVEDQIDEAPLTGLNTTGARPDRLWRDAQHVVLLHDHTGLDCGGYCPAMIWIAPPDHPSAAGYGFEPVSP